MIEAYSSTRGAQRRGPRDYLLSSSHHSASGVRFVFGRATHYRRLASDRCARHHCYCSCSTWPSRSPRKGYPVVCVAMKARIPPLCGLVLFSSAIRPSRYVAFVSFTQHTQQCAAAWLRSPGGCRTGLAPVRRSHLSMRGDTYSWPLALPAIVARSVGPGLGTGCARPPRTLCAHWWPRLLPCTHAPLGGRASRCLVYRTASSNAN